MHIGILTIQFRLHGCNSLKEKRHRLSAVKSRFGKVSNIAVCESDRQDALGFAELSFVSTSQDKANVESGLAKIVDFCLQNIDAEVINHTIEWG